MTAADDRRVLVLLNAGFVLAGMATTLLGPMMPMLMTRWELSDASAGTLFTAQFTGQTLSTIGSSLLTARLGDRRTLTLGLFVTAVGVAALGLAPWPLGALAAIVYGVGLGLVLPITNFVVASMRPAGAAAALSLLNVSWGIGAVLWAVVVRASMAVVPHPVAPLLLLSASTAVLGGVLLARPGVWPAERRAAASTVRSSAETHQRARPAIASMVALFAALSYLYVGAETAIGGWIAEFTRRAGPTAGSVWALAPTAFWGAETLGRLAAPLLLRRVPEPGLLVGGLSVASLAVVLLVSGSDSVGLALTGAVMAGFGLAPIFPLIVADMTRRVTPVAPGLMGPLFAMGGLGGATVPLLVGLTSTLSGQLRAGLFVPLAALLAMLTLQAVARRPGR